MKSIFALILALVGVAPSLASAQYVVACEAVEGHVGANDSVTTKFLLPKEHPVVWFWGKEFPEINVSIAVDINGSIQGLYLSVYTQPGDVKSDRGTMVATTYDEAPLVAGKTAQLNYFERMQDDYKFMKVDCKVLHKLH